MEEVKKTFRPEFLNRVDEMIVFTSLSDAELKQVVQIMLKNVARRLKDNELDLEVTENAQNRLLQEGRDDAYGARPLRRAIQKMVEDSIAEMLLRREVAAGDTVLVDADENGKLIFAKKS